MVIIKIILVAFFLILFTLSGKSQLSSSAQATVSATIISPVGTGRSQTPEVYPNPGPSTGKVDEKSEQFQLLGTNKFLLQETRDNKVIQVLSNGAIFDITVNYDPLILDNHREIRVESISPILLTRNKFILDTKLRVEPGYAVSRDLLMINCDIIIHFN